jgi:ferric-dicitrate binding protein FerR (iron transport regulator)
VDSRRLDEKLAPPLEEAEIAQVWRGVKEARAEAPARRRRRMVGVGVAVAAMAAAAVVAVVMAAGGGDRASRGGASETAGGASASAVAVASGGGSAASGGANGGGGSNGAGAVSGPITSVDLVLEPGARVKPAAERTIAMNDGSVVALAAASELEVLANETDKFVTAVRKGWAHFDVNPGGGRRWVIETDLATVEVVGTAFVVERAETHLAVRVERGVVLVRGAGEALEVPAQVAAAPAPAARTDTPPPTARTDAPPPPTRPLAPPAETAIARADALLARGKAIDAADELERFLDDAGDDAGAGLAAFMLGRIAQDQLGDPERAAAAFARTLAIGSPRAVQDEARTRRTRALAAAGRTE